MSLHVLVVLGLFVLLGGGAGVRVVQVKVQDRILDAARSTSRIVSALVVERNITATVVRSAALPDDMRADMDGDVAQLRGKATLVGLQVWSASDGHLIYADTAQPDGAVLPASEWASARGGRLAVVSGDERNVRTLDVFLRYDPGGDRRDGVIVQVLLPDDQFSRALSRFTTGLYLAAAFLLVLVLLAVLTQVRRHRQQRYAARHDGLTGLGNRLLLSEVARPLLAAASARRPVGLLLLDLDGFKEINDTLGHDAGDELLATVAERLRAACAGAPAVIRLGGDEFVVLLTPGAVEDPAGDVLATAERIRAALRRPIVLSGLSVEVDASVGAALGPADGADLGTLLKRADTAMYEAKRSGQGTCLTGAPQDPADGGRLTLLADLREAIGTGALHLRYQPQCDADGRVFAAEALLRWEHPERGLLEPVDFLPFAERTSLIKPLTAWVLHRSAAQCAAWREEGHDLRITVNVAARSLLDDDLPEMVRAATEAAGLPCEAVILEISEQSVLADRDRSARVLGELAGLGVSVSIDNFGAGYDSLSSLPLEPVRMLKIDRRYVGRVLDNPVDEALVLNAIRLARDLGLTSVGHGVESAETWRRLAELGCDEIQGQVLTAPLPPAEFGRWLADWNPASVRFPPVPPPPRHRRPDLPINLDRAARVSPRA